MIRTDAEGRFIAKLPPGSYRVAADADAAGVQCLPLEVTVQTGSYTVADIECV